MKDPNQEELKENPPLFNSWNGWYVVVLGNLVLLIILFYLFSQFFK